MRGTPWTRVQRHGRGCSIPDEAMESPARARWARRHGRGHGEGGVSSTDEGAARGMLAPGMRRVAQMVGCAVMHALRPAGADVPGGHGGDDGGGGAGGVAVPHLRRVEDACGGHGAGAVAQFMMHALGCMSDSKGTGCVCVCMEGRQGSALSLKPAVRLAKSLVCARTVENVY